MDPEESRAGVTEQLQAIEALLLAGWPLDEVWKSARSAPDTLARLLDAISEAEAAGAKLPRVKELLSERIRAQGAS